MKKCKVLIISVIFVVYYVLVCTVLQKRILYESSQEDNHLLDVLSLTQKCSCNSFRNEKKIVSQNSHELLLTTGNTCSAQETELFDRQADIQMQSISLEMKIDYPSYIWTHNGWIQQMDTTYDSHQWDDNPLIVHIVPFSHNDPGWLSSFESYYTSWTRPTLDLAVEYLTSNTNLTFVWAEVLFIERWFNQLTEGRKEAFRQLLNSGRFEIVTGGWVMTDESVVNYEAMLDQLTEGHMWLQQEFGYLPKTAWAIDPFGHSPTMAYLLKHAGVKSMLIQRAHYAIKKHLAFRRQLEFSWLQSWDVRRTNTPPSSSERSDSIFCQLTPYMLYSIQYSCGPDINVCCQFDFTRKKCWHRGDYTEPEPISDNNILSKAEDLVDQLRKKAQFFRHNHVLFPFGDDFRFHDRSEWAIQFGNLTKLIDFINSRSELHVQMRYSTLGEYMSAAQEALQVPDGADSAPIPSLSGDFLPYSDRSDQYWTGFYSTRPLLKRMARWLQSQLRAVEILYTLVSAFSTQPAWLENMNVSQRKLVELYGSLVQLRRSSASLQHHDAITGTARQSVVLDYLISIKSSLHSGRQLTGTLISALVRSSMTSDMDEYSALEVQADATALPELPVLQNSTSILIFNPLTRHRVEIMKTVVSSAQVSVTNDRGESISCQLNPIIDRSFTISDNRFEVYFEVSIPPLGLEVFYIKPVLDEAMTSCKPAKIMVYSKQHQHNIQSPFPMTWHSEMAPMSIANNHFGVNFCQCSRLMQGVTHHTGTIPIEARMNYVTYSTGKWLNPFADKSGAYLFLPDGPSRDLVYDNPSSLVIKGELVSSATSWVSSVAIQTITVFNTTGSQGVGVHITNSINLKSYKNNTEVAMKLSTLVDSGDEFYVDLNAFQMHRHTTQKRVPLQGNFRPMTAAVFLQDKVSRITLLSKQSHGAASLESGSLEVILDRRLAQDDWRGLREGLIDNVPVSSEFVLLFETFTHRRTVDNAHVGFMSLQSHHISQTLNNPLVPVFRTLSTPDSVPDVKPVRPFQSALPCDVHLVNLRSYPINSFNATNTALLVLHRLGIDCGLRSSTYGAGCSKSANDEISLRDLCDVMHVSAAQETALTGLSPESPLVSPRVHMLPMDIKSLRLTM